MTQEILDELVEAEKDDIFQMGRAYGDDSVALPMLVKHFGNPATGGLAEAIHRWYQDCSVQCGPV